MTNRLLPTARPILLMALIWAVAVSTPLLASELVVTRYFSGLWDQPRQENQGVVLQIVDTDPERKNAVAYWFTYGDDTVSGQRWLTAQGGFAGSTAAIDIYETTGGLFDDPHPVDVSPVGTMTIDFADCSNAQLSYTLSDQGLGGDMEISQLISNAQGMCEELAGAQ